MKPTQRTAKTVRNEIGLWSPLPRANDQDDPQRSAESGEQDDEATTNGQTKATTNGQAKATTNSQTKATAGHQNAVCNRVVVKSAAGEQNQKVCRYKVAQNQASIFFTLKRWKIESTIDRTQICLWTFIMMMKLLMLVVVVSFWIASLLFVKTLATWGGFQRVMDGFARRREMALNAVGDQAGNANDAGADDGQNQETIWEDLFPAGIRFASYHLNLIVSDSGLRAARPVFGLRFALLLTNPIVWLLVILILFISHHLIKFVHDCLQNALQATRVTFLHQNLTKQHASHLNITN